jgi:hypothetical protein
VKVCRERVATDMDRLGFDYRAAALRFMVLPRFCSGRFVESTIGMGWSIKSNPPEYEEYVTTERKAQTLQIIFPLTLHL